MELQGAGCPLCGRWKGCPGCKRLHEQMEAWRTIAQKAERDLETLRADYLERELTRMQCELGLIRFRNKTND